MSRLRIVAIALVTLLTACGEGPERPASPPRAAGPGPIPGPIIREHPRSFQADPPVLDQIRAIERRFVGAIEYEFVGMLPGYPTVERDTVNFLSNPKAPPQAVAMIHELPTTELEGRLVACGDKHVRVELYDDESIDVILTERGFTRDWYELNDGSRVPAEAAVPVPGKPISQVLYHFTPDGEYTVQSLVERVRRSRSHATGAEIRETFLPLSLAGRAAALPGAEVVRDARGHVISIRAPSSRPGMVIEIECPDWEDLPVPHPIRLIRVERVKQNGAIDSANRYVRLKREDG